MDLRVCGDIQEAIKLSKDWQLPLLVFVHEKPKEPASDAITLATDVPGLYDTLPHGQKTLSMTFRLSSASLAGDGLAQRLALEAILKESRLSLVTLVHFIEAGSPAHDMFTTAVHDGSGIVPRLHFFPSSQREISPAVIHGTFLHSVKICEMIRIALQMPTLTRMRDAQREFMEEVDVMNAAHHSKQGSQTDARSAMHSPRSTFQSAEPDAMSPLTGESAWPGTAGLHFIALHGLEKKRAILTSPGMTLRTIWLQANQSLQSRAAAASAEGIPSQSTRFELCVESQSAEITVRSVDEASRMNIHNLPHNTVVRVVMLDKDASSDGKPLASLTSSKSSHCPSDAVVGSLEKLNECKEATDNKPRVQCDGNSCRLEAPHAELKGESESQPQPKTGDVALITIRCLLPDGGAHVVSGIDPSLATLSGNLREPVAAALGHDKFVFAIPYPPRRYTADEETCPLRSIGIRSSSAVRVVLTGGPSAQATAQPPQRDTSRGLFGIVSAILSQVRGGTQSVEAALTRSTHPPVVVPTAPSPAAATTTTTTNTHTSAQANRTAGGGKFRTMAEIRASEEEEERRAALEELAQEQSQDANRRKKTNRYYGGNTTEFLGDDGSDGSGDKKDQKCGEEGNTTDGAKKNK